MQKSILDFMIINFVSLNNKMTKKTLPKTKPKALILLQKQNILKKIDLPLLIFITLYFAQTSRRQREFAPTQPVPCYTQILYRIESVLIYLYYRRNIILFIFRFHFTCLNRG